MRTIGILLLIYVSVARADNLEQIYVRRVAHARSASEITQLEDLNERTQIARRACRIQIEKELAPSACFEALDFETKWGLHTKKSRSEFMATLDHLCAQASARLQVPRQIPNEKYLSANCRKSIEQAIEARIYREGRTWSEN